MALLEVSGVSKRFGGLQAVKAVSFRVEKGMIKAVIGPNGAGKTTLFNIVSGFLPPDAGTVAFRGEPIQATPPHRVAARGLSRTFQHMKLFAGMSALENVMVALRGVYRSPLPLVLAGLARKEERRAQADALALLELVGLAGEARTPAKDLTYGAQRFLEIARALARKPEILILDEPAAGLAHPDVVKQVELIRRIAQRGVTIVLIEHHMDVVTELCDVVTVLDGGKVIAEGAPDEVKRHPRVVEAYLGEVEPGAEPAPAAAPYPA